MQEANQSIEIYQGVFQIECDNDLLDVEGEVKYNWFPEMGIYFSGVVNTSPQNLTNFINKTADDSILINGAKLAVKRMSFTKNDKSQTIKCKGIIVENAVTGKINRVVDKVRFALPNFKKFSGAVIKDTNSQKRKLIYWGRMEFDCSEYKVLIDKHIDFEILEESVTEKGGFIINYSGEIISLKKGIRYSEWDDLAFCLSIFLSFLNGRFISPLFCSGIKGDSDVWNSYPSNKVSQYKYVQSWTDDVPEKHLGIIWKRFYELWKNKDDKLFLIHVVRWYISANSNSDFTESKIMTSQTALELIYNWFLIENKKIMSGNDTANISASNKIRLLLSYLNVSMELPARYSMLKKEAKGRGNDGPEEFVFIRNAIVHSQQKKREKLSAMDEMAKYEALQLGLWYIELSLLFILGYKGQYNNRSSSNRFIAGRVETVPWAISTP